MIRIENKNFPSERDLYGVDGASLYNCTFDGEEDGESALKEAKNVRLEICFMNLRYPLWHDVGVELFNCEMTEKCRAALWYSSGIRIENCKLHGIKALRECGDVYISESDVISPEFGWKSRNVEVEDSSLESEYLFFEAKNVRWKNNKFKGKYSFQYVEGAVIEDCFLDTKDAFWHSKNVTVKNSVIKGEYLAWYAENLTLINCRIEGTQPLCYCKGLRLINCTMVAADFSFEYSQVEADIEGEILSVKNPLSGKITADGIGEIMLTNDSKYPCRCEIEIRAKK